MAGNCTYCGLPVPQPWWNSGGASTASAAAQEPEYCCFGCRVAHAVTAEQGEEGATRWTLTQIGLAVFLTMNVMVCTLALWGMDGSSPEGTPELASGFADLLRFAALLLTLPVLFLLGRPLLENAWSQWRSGVFSADLLLLTGVVAAFGYSTWSVWSSAWWGETGPVYFEVSCMILVLVTVGRWLEATGKLRSTQALDQLERLLPETVLQLQTDGTWQDVPLAEVPVGSTLKVWAGDRIPTDGRLLSAMAVVDEQLMTGESWPVEKYRNDPLSGGTLNLAGELQLEVTATARSGTLARLIAAVREARLQKGHYEQLADRVTHWFFPIMLIVAAGTFAVHSLLSGVMTGTLAALAVLLIACPCALGLATPMAIWAAMGAAAKRGVVFRTPLALERLAGLRALRIDKTGTLTTGQPVVESINAGRDTPVEEVLERAAALAATSRHAFSKAILASIKNTPEGDRAASLPTVTEVRSLAGLGITGHIAGEATATALGNARLMDSCGWNWDPEIAEARAQAVADGLPLVLIGWEGRVRGLITLREQLRPAAAELSRWANSQHLDVLILTGDHRRSAERIGQALNWPVLAELSPAEKATAVRAAREQFGGVIVVGDGVNDAPALSLADVGIALGCGADVTRNAADVCLIGDELSSLPWLIELSQATVRTVKGNLAWAFGYNTFGVCIATTGWLHPAFAAFLMVASSLFVISNSLRLTLRTGSSGTDLQPEPRDESARPDNRSIDQPPLAQLRSTTVRNHPADEALAVSGTDSLTREAR